MIGIAVRSDLFSPIPFTGEAARRAGEGLALDLWYLPQSFFFAQKRDRTVVIARAGAKSLGPRLRGNDDKGIRAALATIFLIVAMLFSCSAFAQVATNTAPLQFQDTTEERRFAALVSELRCVMCQNQSLADSNAQIANDLRHEVLNLMRQGKSDTEVKSFLVARYGEFVLYRPRVASKTWLLWFGPAVLLLVGGLVIARVVRKRTDPGHAVPVDDTQEW